MSAERIPIRFGRWKPVLIAIGLTPGRCYLEVGPDLVRVHMSWCFHAEVPRASIRSVSRVKNPYPGSFGAHGWRGRWLVNGAAGPLVAVELEPFVRARTVVFPIRLRQLIVSVDDPDGLVAKLSQGTGPAASVRSATPPAP
jgi:hypothetical protein